MLFQLLINVIFLLFSRKERVLIVAVLHFFLARLILLDVFKEKSARLFPLFLIIITHKKKKHRRKKNGKKCTDRCDKALFLSVCQFFHNSNSFAGFF